MIEKQCKAIYLVRVCLLTNPIVRPGIGKLGAPYMVQIVWIKLIFHLSKKNRVVLAVCVVVAPLVDLVNDHVSSLQRKCIAANPTFSGQP